MGKTRYLIGATAESLYRFAEGVEVFSSPGTTATLEAAFSPVKLCSEGRDGLLCAMRACTSSTTDEYGSNLIVKKITLEYEELD